MWLFLAAAREKNRTYRHGSGKVTLNMAMARFLPFVDIKDRQELKPFPSYF